RLAVGRGEPEVRDRLVDRQVNACDDVDDERAVRADLRVADALEREQVVELHRPFGRRGDRPGHGEEEDGGEDNERAEHGRPLKKTNHRGTEGTEEETQRNPLYFFSMFLPLCPLCLCGSFNPCLSSRRRRAETPTRRGRAAASASSLPSQTARSLH